jgi:hypothetical protein
VWTKKTAGTFVLVSIYVVEIQDMLAACCGCEQSKSVVVWWWWWWWWWWCVCGGGVQCAVAASIENSFQRKSDDNIPPCEHAGMGSRRSRYPSSTSRSKLRSNAPMSTCIDFVSLAMVNPTPTPNSHVCLQCCDVIHGGNGER